MKHGLTILATLLSLGFLSCTSCGKEASGKETSVQEEKPSTATVNMERAMTLADKAFENYFETGVGMKMSRYFNPFTLSKSSEVASVWMYTASIEAVVSIMEGLVALKSQGNAELYEKNFSRYSALLSKLFDGLQYYKGTYTLTSYTGTATWSAYAVNRASAPGTADMSGVLNVYDDQMWLIRELVGAYKLTLDKKYLDEAENLAAYVIDGYDCTLDADGHENGGITWGPGYVTKHSCSNSPVVSPLVWLSELYQGKSDEMTIGIVLPKGERSTRTLSKAECYRSFAEKAYSYQRTHLLRSDGVYDDMMGGYRTGGGKPEYETIDGVRYRKNTALTEKVGPAISYNSGTMLSGAADLLRLTGESKYREDLEALSSKSFSYFSKLGANVEGYYTYDITGFNNWFNDVLMRGYIACSEYCDLRTAIDSFQRNLDYGWDKFQRDGMLPPSLLAGWNTVQSKNNVEGMFTFAFASEYASLAKFSIEK